MDSFQGAQRIVIKVGTSTLTYETGLINIRRLESLVKVLSDLANAGREIILVTSGAIGVGLGKLGLRERPSDTPSRQAAAAVGQNELMHVYDNLFSSYGHTIAQILLTQDIFDHELRRSHVVNTFEKLLSLHAIPVVNENDTVSVEELEGAHIGDNDTLSAIVASLVRADGLIILSDIDGLYDAHPGKNPDAKLIPRVEHINDYIESIASDPGSSRGTGGMRTKIQAAKIVEEAGINMAIVNGAHPEILYDLFEGQQRGTFFCFSK